MIEIKDIGTYGWEDGIRKAHIIVNDYNETDSHWVDDYQYSIGSSDRRVLSLAKNQHKKDWRECIRVSMIITAPLYWWVDNEKYFDSTKIKSDFKKELSKNLLTRPLNLTDFSFDTLDLNSMQYLEKQVEFLNRLRNENVSIESIIRLIPMSIHISDFVTTNYWKLNHMYSDHCTVNDSEWIRIIEIINRMPYSEYITQSIDIPSCYSYCV